jgi:hypothetical protein
MNSWKMTPKNAFKYYTALHLHFNNLEYEMQKYGINTRAANSAWDNLSENHRFRFDWLANTYINDQELVLTIIGAELAGLSIRFDSKDDIKKTSNSIRSRRNAIKYHLENEKSKYDIEDMDSVIMSYFSGTCIPEYVLLRDNTTEILKTYLVKPEFSFARSEVIKLIKYRTFFNPTKYTINEIASV